MSVQSIGPAVPNLAPVQPAVAAAPAGPQGGQTGQPGLPPPAMLAQAAMAEAAETLGRIVVAGGEAPAEAPDIQQRAAAATGQAREILLASPAIQAKAISDLVGRAAAAQGGMAPLMADLERVMVSPDAPAIVRQAAGRVLALRSPIDAAVTAGEVRQAFQRSGLFMESRLAGEVHGAPLAVKDLKAAMLVLRAAVSHWSAQAGPAPALSSSPAMLAADAQDVAAVIPRAPGGGEAVARSPAAVSFAQAPGGAPAALVAAAGAETPDAPVSTAARDAPVTSPASPAPDLPDSENPVARFLAAMGPRPTPQQPAQSSAALFVLAQEAAAEFVETPRPPATPAQALAPSLPGAGKGPPPPFAGGPVVAQAPVASTLSREAPPAAVAQHLARGVDAALARQELLQAASLPEPVEAARTADGRPVEDRSGPRWVFDVPFATAQGSAVAQFEISRDGGGGGALGAGEEARTWKVRFSLDAEPMGRIDAQLALTGERARVSLWAERPESMARLRGAHEMLSAALREQALEPEVAFLAAPAPQAPAAPGRFVDRAT